MASKRQLQVDIEHGGYNKADSKCHTAHTEIMNNDKRHKINTIILKLQENLWSSLIISLFCYCDQRTF